MLAGRELLDGTWSARIGLALQCLAEASGGFPERAEFLVAASAGTVSQPAAACERCAELGQTCAELGEKCIDPRAALAAALARIEALEGQRKEFQRDKFGRKNEALGPP